MSIATWFLSAWLRALMRRRSLARELETGPAAGHGHRNFMGAAFPVAPAVEAAPHVMVSQVVILVGFARNGRGWFQRDAARTGTCRECPREAFRCVVRENHDPVYVRVGPQAGLRAVDCGGVTEPGPVGGPARPGACAARSGIR